MNKFAEGIVTALITPLSKSGELCVECLDSLLGFQIGRGVSGLFLTGTYGEGVILPRRVKEEVYRRALELAGSKIYLLPHVGTADIEAVVSLARAARDVGYEAVSTLGPIYHKPTRRGLVEYFEYVATKADVKVVIYNNKGRQGYNISPDDFEEIVRNVPHVIGLKDTSYDVDQMLEYYERFGSRYLIAGAGDSLLFYTFALGIPLHICGISNALPELAVELYRSVSRGNLKRALGLQYSILKIRKVVNKLGVESQVVLREVLKWRGLDLGYPPVALRASLDAKVLEDLRKTVEAVYSEQLGAKL
ncbi:MAG: dihydrodipicolinate synthase family protein [Sulfolobales archaeon]|nr:dihydrodipicolinate synthase family protein [Sulfolobales archaeon]MCX8209163.1 dihydrodipicolinate synthase family protein [Sulfolobales archaeon]MDW8010938.1 dihydrodipicolinate synthase family protein [Sulfolobales archaeon]